MEVPHHQTKEERKDMKGLGEESANALTVTGTQGVSWCGG
jgi:hypothetical protein